MLNHVIDFDQSRSRILDIKRSICTCICSYMVRQCTKKKEVKRLNNFVLIAIERGSFVRLKKKDQEVYHYIDYPRSSIVHDFIRTSKTINTKQDSPPDTLLHSQHSKAMYISFRETPSNEWTAVCESCADWLKFEDQSKRDQQVVKRALLKLTRQKRRSRSSTLTETKPPL